MAFFRQAFIIMVKDLRAELRSKEAINASFAFALVILILFSFAFDPDQEMIRSISGGLIWIVFAFAGTLVLNRSFVRELPNDCLDALVAAPVSRAALYLGKALANLVIVMSVELVSMPVFGVFYNVRWAQRFWQLAGVLVLGAWGLTVVGTFLSALTVNIRLREIMLPLLIYPLMIPSLMASMRLTTELVAGRPIAGDETVWLKMLIAFDAIFTALSLALVETVLIG